MMAAAMALGDYIKALGLSDANFAQRVEDLTGVHLTRQLVTDASHYDPAKRLAIAAPIANAIATYLSKAYERPITPADIAGMKVVV